MAEPRNNNKTSPFYVKSNKTTFHLFCTLEPLSIKKTNGSNRSGYSITLKNARIAIRSSLHSSNYNFLLYNEAYRTVICLGCGCALPNRSALCTTLQRHLTRILRTPAPLARWWIVDAVRDRPCISLADLHPLPDYSASLVDLPLQLGLACSHCSYHTTGAKAAHSH